MSRSLIKFVDDSLFPAAILVASKFLGLALVLRLFNVSWSLREYTDGLFAYRTVVKAEDLALVTSYSDLFMFVVVTAFFTFTVIRAVYFHSSHVKPTLVVKLANNNLLRLVQSSYQVYHHSFVWLIFSWISNILVLINVFVGNTYAWIGIVTFVVNVLLTVILLQDVYKEIEDIKKHPGRYNWQ